MKGPKGGCFKIDPEDKLAVKLAMLIEGHCTIGVSKALEKYGYSEQRYYQVKKLYLEGGTKSIMDRKRGSDKRPTRTTEVVSQIIRMRFLDPLASTEVITQKLNQRGYAVSKRSVERTITEFGLQKKLIR